MITSHGTPQVPKLQKLVRIRNPSDVAGRGESFVEIAHQLPKRNELWGKSPFMRVNPNHMVFRRALFRRARRLIIIPVNCSLNRSSPRTWVRMSPRPRRILGGELFHGSIGAGIGRGMFGLQTIDLLLQFAIAFFRGSVPLSNLLLQSC